MDNHKHIMSVHSNNKLFCYIEMHNEVICVSTRLCAASLDLYRSPLFQIGGVIVIHNYREILTTKPFFVFLLFGSSLHSFAGWTEPSYLIYTSVHLLFTIDRHNCV